MDPNPNSPANSEAAKLWPLGKLRQGELGLGMERPGQWPHPPMGCSTTNMASRSSHVSSRIRSNISDDQK